MLVKLEIDGPIARLILNRPERLNAYNQAMLATLETHLNTVRDSAAIKVLIVQSSSANFCTGADLKELRQRSYHYVLNLKSRRLFETLFELPVISIAAIKGYAVAGGFELALSCDFMIAADTARFQLPEVSLGLIPAAGGIERLVQLLGPRLTREIVLTGRSLDAAAAQTAGLVTETVPEPQLEQTVLKLAETLTARPSGALKIAKLAINEASVRPRSALNLFGQAFLNELKANQPVS